MANHLEQNDKVQPAEGKNVEHTLHSEMQSLNKIDWDKITNGAGDNLNSHAMPAADITRNREGQLTSISFAPLPTDSMPSNMQAGYSAEAPSGGAWNIDQREATRENTVSNMQAGYSAEAPSGGYWNIHQPEK